MQTRAKTRALRAAAPPPHLAPPLPHDVLRLVLAAALDLEASLLERQRSRLLVYNRVSRVFAAACAALDLDVLAVCAVEIGPDQSGYRDYAGDVYLDPKELLPFVHSCVDGDYSAASPNFIRRPKSIAARVASSNVRRIAIHITSPNCKDVTHVPEPQHDLRFCLTSSALEQLVELDLDLRHARANWSGCWLSCCPRLRRLRVHGWVGDGICAPGNGVSEPPFRLVDLELNGVHHERHFSDWLMRGLPPASLSATRWYSGSMYRWMSDFDAAALRSLFVHELDVYDMFYLRPFVRLETLDIVCMVDDGEGNDGAESRDGAGFAESGFTVMQLPSLRRLRLGCALVKCYSWNSIRGSLPDQLYNPLRVLEYMAATLYAPAHLAASAADAELKRVVEAFVLPRFADGARQAALVKAFDECCVDLRFFDGTPRVLDSSERSRWLVAAAARATQIEADVAVFRAKRFRLHRKGREILGSKLLPSPPHSPTIAPNA